MPTCYQRLSNSSEARQPEQFPAANPASTVEPGWTATPVTLSLAILFVARKAKKGDCGLLAADRVAGSAKKIQGSIKEVAGKAAGDAKLEAEGKADKIEGKVQ